MTMTAPPKRAAPSGPYRRRVEGADFSLEANTEAAVEAGYFYVLRQGRVLLRSKHFATAEACYEGLSREYWESRLTSEDLQVRAASAWGLLGLDLEHPGAAAVIRREASPADRRRLEMRQSRRRALAKKSADAQR